MRKTCISLILIFAILLSCLTLFACGEKDDNNQNNNDDGVTLNFGEVYAMAKEAGYTGTMEELVALFKGDSAYQIAVENGYTGSEVDWLASLVGASGKDGTNGKDGANGKDGTNGTNGITPHIGENGNWFIGTTDTGVSAGGLKGEAGPIGPEGPQGPKGEDGKTPSITIGENGNWFVDGVDTGVGASSGSAGITKKVTVTFHVNGGTFDNASGRYTQVGENYTIVLNKGDTLGKIPLVEKEGYVFNGWVTGYEVGDGYWYNDFTVSSDLDLYATWFFLGEINDYYHQYCITNGWSHVCVVCNRPLECEDRDDDHYCDYGYYFSERLSDCVDENNDHDCDICGDEMSHCVDKNGDHYCDLCGEVVEITVKFYHTMVDRFSTILENHIVEFNKLYPDIKIEHEHVGGYEDVRDQIITEINVGAQPNVAYCYPEHVALYNVAGAVQTLDEFIDSTEVVTRADGTTEILGLTAEQKADFIEGFYNEGKSFGDGKTYTLPMSKSTEVLYYNKTFFEANNLTPPTTWDEMEELCARIKQIDPDCIPLGYDSEANWFITMCQQYGSPYTSATGDHFLFNNDTNKSFVNRFKSWYEKGYVITQEIHGGYTFDIFTGQWNDTRSYMYIGASSATTYIRSQMVNDAYPFDVGITTIPQVDVNNPKVIYHGPSLCIFGKESEEEVKATWLFVKYLTTNVEFQSEFSMASSYVPVIKSVTENDAYKSYLDNADGGDNISALASKVCLEQINAYFTPPAFNGATKARDEVGNLMVQCLTGKKTIEQAFKEAIDECNYYI